MKRLTKSPSRIFGGVLGGIANYFDIDPVWIRLGFVVFAFINAGAAIFFYLIALFVMPDSSLVHTNDTTRDKEIHQMKEKVTDRRFISLAGLLLILIGVLFLLGEIYDLNLWYLIREAFHRVRDFVWPIVLILLGGWIIYRGVKK